jgi:hypothetical protein
MRHAARVFGTHSPVHALRAAKTAMHAMVPTFHHHFMMPTRLTRTTVMNHPVNASSDNPKEKYEPDYDEEPGYPGKKSTCHFFFEFCKQKGSCKDGQ